MGGGGEGRPEKLRDRPGEGPRGTAGQDAPEAMGRPSFFCPAPEEMVDQKPRPRSGEGSQQPLKEIGGWISAWRRVFPPLHPCLPPQANRL